MDYFLCQCLLIDSDLPNPLGLGHETFTSIVYWRVEEKQIKRRMGKRATDVLPPPINQPLGYSSSSLKHSRYMAAICGPPKEITTVIRVFLVDMFAFPWGRWTQKVLSAGYAKLGFFQGILTPWYLRSFLPLAISLGSFFLCECLEATGRNQVTRKHRGKVRQKDGSRRLYEHGPS